ncbi:DUF6478 family protein [Jannaschia formosa]|uniref:DUF6478 family protein n=1 Tax=Jannaschia formosa TaxID=2259592 RepID=UPI000E1BC37D|nr:DUF6478 family protein [Jannaschia formosa]TFL18077.1 hypothetical protein DR046_11580 [Jannaschia formosa]
MAWRLPLRRQAPQPPLPRSDPAVTDRPALCDWAWRPPVWAAPQPGVPGRAAPGGHALALGCTLFHDDPGGAVSARQVATPGGPAPFALTLEVGAFAGSYLSLALDLPADAARSATRRDIFRLAVAVAAPPALYARLNLRHGPNTEALTDHLRPDGTVWAVELDLGFTPLGPGGVEAAWIDLSFDVPSGMALTLADLTLTRRPRAEL